MIKTVRKLTVIRSQTPEGTKKTLNSFFDWNKKMAILDHIDCDASKSIEAVLKLKAIA